MAEIVQLVAEKTVARAVRGKEEECSRELGLSVGAAGTEGGG